MPTTSLVENGASFRRVSDKGEKMNIYSVVKDLLYFYADCPKGKRGRPLSVATAAKINKIDSGAICQKETVTGPKRTIFYRVNKAVKVDTEKKPKLKRNMSDAERKEYETYRNSLSSQKAATKDLKTRPRTKELDYMKILGSENGEQKLLDAVKSATRDVLDDTYKDLTNAETVPEDRKSVEWTILARSENQYLSEKMKHNQAEMKKKEKAEDKAMLDKLGVAQYVNLDTNVLDYNAVLSQPNGAGELSNMLKSLPDSVLRATYKKMFYADEASVPARDKITESILFKAKNDYQGQTTKKKSFDDFLSSQGGKINPIGPTGKDIIAILPKLSGSEKQIQWGEQIRQGFFKKLNADHARLASQATTPAQKNILNLAYDKIVHDKKNHKTAEQWIDSRHIPINLHITMRDLSQALTDEQKKELS